MTSRPGRNRYRRRPSRLTALGKSVVATTVAGMLALGWASQASRQVDAPLPEAARRPVSAPPRWPAPSLGAFAGQEAPQKSPQEAGRGAMPERSAIPTDSSEDRRAAAATASHAVEPGTGEMAPMGPAGLADLDDPAPSGGVADPHVPASASSRESGVGLRAVTPPASRARFEQARAQGRSLAADTATARSRLVEWVEPRAIGLDGDSPLDPMAMSPESTLSAVSGGPVAGRVRVEYSLDEALTASVFEILRHGRVERGIAIVIDPKTGRLLAYATTDANVLPVERAYPAASIVKVVTAAAMLEQRPDPNAWDCLYEGNKYRLSQRRLDRPKRGHHASLEDAMASSNNQCFSQWAIHGLGEPRLRRMLDLFGWSGVPALGHSRGRVDPAATRLDLGQLGSGLDGVRVTPLHVASLATVLADGRFATPRWIDRVVDAEGRTIPLLRPELPRRVVSPRTAENLREVMVATTKRGTARRAFRTRRGVPVLGSIEVAGKTGNLNGSNPSGRYEWFFGVAPASDPQIGVVVMQVHGHLWWARSSELAANILREVFCDRSACRPELAQRFKGSGPGGNGPVLVSDLAPVAGSRSDPATRD